MIDLSSLPEGTRFLERGGLPVICRPKDVYESAVTGALLRSPDGVIEVSRAEFDELVAQWGRRVAQRTPPRAAGWADDGPGLGASR